jgi:hypothetical protein
MLPSYAAARTRACDAGRKARGLASAVDRCLAVLAAPHAAVLRAVFTPRRWPRDVESPFARLAPLVVRLYGTCDPWPGRGSHQGLEEAVAPGLAAHVSRSRARLEPLRLGAQRLLDAAMKAYIAHRREVAPASR